MTEPPRARPGCAMWGYTASGQLPVYTEEGHFWTPIGGQDCVPIDISCWCSWKRRMSSALAVSGVRPRNTATPRTCRTWSCCVCAPSPRICMSGCMRWRSGVFGLSVDEGAVGRSSHLRDLHDQSAVSPRAKTSAVTRTRNTRPSRGAGSCVGREADTVSRRGYDTTTAREFKHLPYPSAPRPQAGSQLPAEGQRPRVLVSRPSGIEGGARFARYAGGERSCAFGRKRSPIARVNGAFGSGFSPSPAVRRRDRYDIARCEFEAADESVP